MSTVTFMSKDNMVTCINIFCTFMQDKYSVTFKDEEVSELKRTMFKVMSGVNESADIQGRDLHDLNIIVLSKIKDIYTSSMNRHKPNIRNLDRERDVYGNRDITVNELIPKRDPYTRRLVSDDVDKKLDDVMVKVKDERDSLFKKDVPDITRLGGQITESAESADEFIQKLRFLEEERSVVEKSMQLVKPVFEEKNGDPKSIYDKDMFKTENQKVAKNDSMTSRQDLIIPVPGSKDAGGRTSAGTSSGGSSKQYSDLKHYISINSIDRDWVGDVKRYSYSVAFNGKDITGNYKNIKSIRVGKVIIPDDICESMNILNLPNKSKFNYDFSFSYPFLILRIDEFNDVYDGTNDSVRKSFCKLIYCKSHKTRNGRGYIVLEPFQKEKKVFHPSPLSSLNRLTISILKPDGFLVNTSADSYKLFKLDYDPYNPHFFQIVTDVFFDKNEFYVGDVILIKNFVITSETRPIEAKILTDYINKQDGHEVYQIGTTNNNGYWRSFYIKAIGLFDKVNGKFDTDMAVVACLNAYNDTINYNTYVGHNGNILNTSLQNTIGLTLETITSTSHIDTMLI